ncbi:amidohydrolase [Nonomuraea roseoviolacea]|uniref:Amidohydrolase YtcJ n=1 Tax=Nonomuraea roseoviolacea subsp. carminata TaxID=160689 RepID=A0ABT1KAT8_9ACTN|nr:amidohydrolase [Nonomuraea roseoviolacea]MCP2351133.1 putative amidohydrolase YtcJ [Nonomuraea roseoviolacea subsp. carminata]
MTTPADLVLRGGPVHTLGPAPATATAVAVRGGRIIAVGADADVRPLIGAATEVVDLAGRALLPGLQDAHVHPVLAGLTMIQCDLHDTGDADEAVAAVRAYAEANPEAEWISGGGWSMDWFPGGTPSRRLLDAVVPDRPVHLVNRDGHGAWVNSRALRLCGIDASTPDPVDGRIEREADGHPQGTLHEGASALVGRHLPEPAADAVLRGLQAGQRRLHSVGVTAWQDAMVTPQVQRAYLTAAESGLLTARVVGALWWDRERGEEQIPELLARRGGAGRFRATSVKIMQDGVAENFTAAMTSAYLDGCGCATGNRGLSFVDPDRLRTYITRLDAEGFQVHVHAVGDRAAREALDAFEAARAANGTNDHRHHIAHVQVVHPDDVPRFAALGITATIQPLWAAHEPQMDELTIPFLGPEQAGRQYPFGDLARAGARLAAGSDWPVSSPDPFLGIHVAVNRAIAGGSSKVFLPEQRLALTDALAAYTIGTARVNHLDAWTGTIETGKFADLVVTDRDPCAIPADAIAGTSVLATYVEGERVHTDPAF